MYRKQTINNEKEEISERVRTIVSEEHLKRNSTHLKRIKEACTLITLPVDSQM